MGKEKAKEEKTKKVDFNFSAPHAGSISIAGNFNDWNPGSHPMKKDKKGAWKISLNLAPEHTSIDSIKYKMYCFLQAADISKDMEVSFVWFHEEKGTLKTILPMKMGKR